MKMMLTFNHRENAVSATYLTPYQLHKRWAGAISPKTLANWRAKGEGPKWGKVGGRVVYAVDDVLAYERRRESAA